MAPLARPLSATLLAALTLSCAGSGCAGETAGEATETTETASETAETAGETADDTAGETTEGAPQTFEGCAGASFLALPDDPAARGPWPVGALTSEVSGLSTEIWYPAALGSELGAPAKTYDIREALPPSEQAKISDELAPAQSCACVDDLPIDAERGPYPVIVFIHGTAAWRSQSLTQMTHWASRGFVVVSADHPGLWLADLLSAVCGGSPPAQDLGGDTDTLLAALAAPSGPLAFLDGHLDLERVAIVGHSAGGNAAALQTGRPGVQVAIPMAAAQAVSESATLASTLLLAALTDGVVPYESSLDAYAESPAPKRFVGIADAGHLAFSDICALKNADGQNILEIAVDAGVCGAELAGALFDCDPAFLDAAIAGEIIDYTTTAALEQVLQCRDLGDPFADLQARFPEVAEYREELP
ncbi:hypothetical protein G6O69_25045 [Pseudenhygromyxa sp. WMMC2535]|uniref:alpha/beta hydrolase n=1 Tax=Pseudenhygromyxa sp. WMMC2535 TaxID=2712867 RepID=UPI001557EC13|nr:hypothetical protein [Pseudenhygromyxa sp. WMMC2535]NVB41131.1 hypothetical protein [Pseudenhygromyxa sp. WMMC2535]